MYGPRIIDTSMIRKLTSRQIKRYPTSFGNTYRAIRLVDREVAFYRTTQGKYHIFLCMPYDTDEDKSSGVVGRGASAVIKDWVANSKKEAINTINTFCLTPARIDKPDKRLFMRH